MHALLEGGAPIATVGQNGEIGGGLTIAWIGRQKRKWHPDRFGRMCDVEFRDEGARLSTEVFSLMGQVEEFLRKEEGRKAVKKS
jgi:hypothetical protein